MIEKYRNFVRGVSAGRIGKAGVVSLDELAPKERRARVVAGDRMYLKPNGSFLMVENNRGEYIGRVEMKHGQRLARLRSIRTATRLACQTW